MIKSYVLNIISFLKDISLLVLLTIFLLIGNLIFAFPPEIEVNSPIKNCQYSYQLEDGFGNRVYEYNSSDLRTSFLGVSEPENVHSIGVWANAAKGVTKGTNVVYQGVDAAGKVRYVGITSGNPALRFGEHLNSIGTGKELLRYDVVKGATNLNRTQARVWEQGLINRYGLVKMVGSL